LQQNKKASEYVAKLKWTNLDDSLYLLSIHYLQSLVIQIATMMMNLLCVAFIGMAAAFNVGRMGSVRINKSFLEMAKKSVGDLSDAELKGKRYATHRSKLPIVAKFKQFNV
jgi:ABC-type iron transport system FetAB permease component